MKTLLAATIFLTASGITRLPAQDADDGDKHLGPNPLIVPPHTRPYGKTYGEWSAEWWKWTFRLPITGHPLFDQTGEDAAAGQSGPVWFLGGTYISFDFQGHLVGVADRTIAVPAGKALFFPIINSEVDNVGINPPLSLQQLWAATRANQDGATNMTCTIDGALVQGLTNGLTTPYRVQSPPFEFWMPPTNNLYQWYGVNFSGSDYPAVADGVFLMVRPLPPGPHLIHFTGDVAGADGTISFSLDITYHIFVNEHPPVIAPPTHRAYGQTYGEWSAEWWKWVFRLPVTGHPLFDQTGEDAAAGQSGPVWFLGGTLNVIESDPGHLVGIADRTISVPEGKALFFPIINNEADEPGAGVPTSVDQLRAQTRAAQDGATNMTCIIDGVRVHDLTSGLTTPYRVQSPPFAFWMPPTDNLYQFYGLNFSGTGYPAVADGVFLMLKPLPVGAHTIHFTGDLMGASGTPTLSLDITYRIFVNEGPPPIVSPSSSVHGQTYGEWSVRQWQWLFELPVTGHPLFDAVGIDAAAGQSGPVWFLGSTFSLVDVGGGHFVGVAHRAITVPEDKALFFPIITDEENNVELAPNPPYTTEQLQGIARAVIDGATNLACRIDGQTVEGLTNILTTTYRVQSSGFSFWLPAQDNVLQSNGLDVSGTVYPVVSDGVYLMLRPLRPGFHNIRWSADVLGSEGTPIFSLDITYDINVEGRTNPGDVGEHDPENDRLSASSPDSPMPEKAVSAISY